MLANLAQLATPAGVGLPAIGAPLPWPARIVLAAVLGFLMVWACGPRAIAWLRVHCGEPNKSASAALERLHAAKHGTPSLGGLLLVGSLVLVLAILGDWSSPYLPVMLTTTLALCGVGTADDVIKLRTSRRGLSARAKLALQAAIALAAAAAVAWIKTSIGAQAKLALPLVGGCSMGAWCVPWAAMVIVATSNAVNLTDGLDGLAGGCLALAASALAVAAAVGHAQGLLPGAESNAAAGEMAVVAAALAGVALAFLWFNRHPALVFMGDAGSLPLGGLLGLVAVIAGQELLLIVIGGVFVVEALSVIAQVSWFRLTGRRVLRCAPLHHHFQLVGWTERKIVNHFWIAGGLCAGAGLLMLAAGADQVTPTEQLVTSPPKVRQLGGQEAATFAELF
jgi:phospho-N-acetylmuramoyl-pentapeptide-transferase